MWHVALYNLLLIGTCIYAVRRGGAPERVAAMIMASATLLTVLASSPLATRYRGLETGIFVVDGATFAAFAALAICADRYWPIWVSGFQGGAIASHALKLLEPELVNWAYKFAVFIWAFPIVIMVLIGTIRHQARLRALGTDAPWRRSWKRSIQAGREIGRTRSG